MSDFPSQDLQKNLPKALALLHVGASSYICFVDPCMRNKHLSLRKRIHHWAGVNNCAKFGLTAVTLSTLAAAVNVWKMTKEPAWLLGGALLTCIIPYHLLFMQDETNVLEEDERKGKIELDLDKRGNLCDKLAAWTCKFHVKLALGVLAAGIFVWCEGKSNG